MFMLAKDESEPLFLQALYSSNPDFPYRLRSAVKANKGIDCVMHADILADMYESGCGKFKTFRFDVKDVEERNMGTGNYSLGSGAVDYYSKCADADRAFFAFRLNDGVSKKYGRFLVAPVQDILEKCRLIRQDPGNYLCHIAEIRENGCRSWVLESDIPG